MLRVNMFLWKSVKCSLLVHAKIYLESLCMAKTTNISLCLSEHNVSVLEKFFEYFYFVRRNSRKNIGKNLIKLEISIQSIPRDFYIKSDIK